MTPAPQVSGTAPGVGATSIEDYLADHEPVEIEPGVLIGEYEVTHKLGEGGMGEVYAATHPLIGKRVAIKILGKHVAQNRDVVRRFVAEARAVNQIGHRNIVDVFSFGSLTDGREYYVMEYLAGKSLEDAINERDSWSSEEIVALLGQVGDALHAAHEAGIVHRDLKPDNIYLVDESSGRIHVKLLDFGIAKLSGQDQPLTRTRTGVAMGTPDYMSPEQCRGVNVDHRTDIYALGVMLYRLFTGQHPFSGESAMDLMYKHMHEPPPPPSSIRPVPVLVERLILKCLAKQPDARFQTVRELVKSFEAAATSTTRLQTEDEPVIGEPPPPIQVPAVEAPPAQAVAAAPPARRARWPLVLAAGALLIAGGVAATFALGTGDAPPPAAEPTAPASGVIAAVAIDAAPATADDPEPVREQPDAPPAPATGTLIIKTNLPDAAVFVDGKRVGAGRVVPIEALQPGDYVITVERRRYASQSRSLEVTAGSETTEAFVLEREPRSRPRLLRRAGDRAEDARDTTEDVLKTKPLKDKDATIDVFNR